MDGLAKFESLVSQSQLAIAIIRTPGHDGGFTFLHISALPEQLTDLITNEFFIGIIGGDIAGRRPKFAFAVELTDHELSAINTSVLQLFERALVRAASSLTGVREDLLQKLYNLPENTSTEEN